MTEQLFNSEYYATGCGRPYTRDEHWLAFFDGIAAQIINRLAPAITLDAGCAMGFLVERLRARGVKAWGVDVSEYAIAQVHESVRPYCTTGSVLAPFERRYDLITCIEVLEHLQPEDAPQAVANLCAHSDQILFSSSPDDFDAPTHFNVQPAGYWAELFARQGFLRDLKFDASFLTPWAVLFRRQPVPVGLRQVFDLYEGELASMAAAAAAREAQLRGMVDAYERGKFMRAMKWLRTRLRPAQKPGAPPARTRPEQGARSYAQWLATHEPSQHVLLEQRVAAKAFAKQPLVSFLTPVHNPPPAVINDLLDSVRAQTYANWELCLVDGGTIDPQVKSIMAQAAAAEPRIRLKTLPGNLGISGNTNAALDMASGEFVALLDHDDTIAPDMLFEIVQRLNDPRGANTDIFYFDHDKLSEDGRVREDPMFFPDTFAPEQMLSCNLLLHPVLRRELVEQAGRFNPETDGAQDWDLALRCIDRGCRITHIPRILYHWRKSSTSAASGLSAKPWAIDVQSRVLTAHLRRNGCNDARCDMLAPGDYHLTWSHQNPLVSIIIPTRNNLLLLNRCISTLLDRTRYTNFEVILVDTGSTESEVFDYYATLAQHTNISVITQSGEFNYSRANNTGAQHARGDMLLFLNNDIEVLEPGWLDELVRWAERPGVGAVGAKLLYPDGLIQHAGVVLGMGHIFNGVRENFMSSEFGGPGWYRNFSAVTAACLMTTRAAYNAVNGFDERFKLAFGDIAFCAALRRLDKRIVYTPHARLRHHEGASRANHVPAEDRASALAVLGDWTQQSDPYFSPLLSRTTTFPTLFEETPHEN